VGAPPSFASIREYAARLDDVGFWRPLVAEILARHELGDVAAAPLAGFNATYPTFVVGEVVLKLFGGFPGWRASYEAERAALLRVASDPQIAAPRLIADGSLYDESAERWPYLVISSVSGVPVRQAGLSARELFDVSAELGRQIQRVHALGSSGLPSDADWPALDVAAAASRSSLPLRLVEQVDGFLAKLGPWDRTFVHGDLVANHVFVDSGELCGIIDWGDALVTDRHYELAKLYFDVFRCDDALLRVFLEASEWPIARDFAHRTLGLALHRQATGLIQHLTFDVFHTLPARLPLEQVDSLDELAERLFEI
jgi:aminoglycoside phosphotransferase (APT) family kinase protein